jgi:ABC-2 type transport system permease protein
MNLFTAFRKEWLEALRNYRLLIVIVVLAVFGLTSPLQAKLLPQILATALPLPAGTDISSIIKPATVSDAITQHIKNMSQFELILAVLISMGAIAQEKDKGTAAMMIVKPLPRGSFLGAKFLGLAAVFAIAIAICGIGSYYYTGLLFGFMDILPWLVLNVFLFVYVLVVVAITLFCSTITNSQAAAGGMAIGIIVIGFIIGVIRNLGRYLPGELNTWGVRLMHGATNSSWAALGISLGLIVLPLLAAWLIFKRQEL